MIRFYGGRVLTMDGGMAITQDEVWTDGAKIAYIGSARVDMPVFQREIDLRGDLLMPGFKNAHTHSAMTFLRSYADDLPLREWLFEKVFPMEEKLTPEHVHTLTKLAVLEYLTSGITASFDMYYFFDANAAANIECGFRTVLCDAVSGTATVANRLTGNYEKFRTMDPLISYQLGFHAEYTTGLDCLKEIAEVAGQYRAPVYCHNSETKREVEECLGRYGKTPTELFESVGMYEYGGGGFHCVVMTENDLDIFARRGLWAVTNPGSNSKLASGIAPLTRMMEKGVNLAIGTDGPASNNALDMFREMYMATVLQKLATEDAAACDADKVLHWATVGGARAMGLRDCDVLAAGKNADLIVINLSRPNMQPVNNITKNIVYSGSKENVRLTMVGGKILYENGEFFIGEEPERIYERANAMIREMKS